MQTELKFHTHLRQRKGGEEINGEIGAEVARSDLARIGDEVLAAVDAGEGRDKSCPELEDHVEEEEEVGDGARERDEHAEDDVGLHAGLVPGDGEVEVERVQEQCHDAHVEERAVPSRHEPRTWVEDLVPPRDFLPEGEGFREAAEVG